MAELKNLDVDRVDGVDQPATKLKFLILKAEDPSEIRANAEKLATLCADLIEGIKAMKLPDYAASLVAQMAEMLGRPAPMYARKAADAPASSSPPPNLKESTNMTAEEIQKAVSDAVVKAVAEATATLTKAIDDRITKAIADGLAPEKILKSIEGEIQKDLDGQDDEGGEPVRKVAVAAASTQPDLDAGNGKRSGVKKKLGEGLFRGLLTSPQFAARRS